MRGWLISANDNLLGSLIDIVRSGDGRGHYLD